MNTTPRLLTLALTLAAAALLGTAAPSQAQTVITALPYTISTGGLYVLNSNLNSSEANGALITIAASNVTIDFQGHYIAGPVGVTNQFTNAIYGYEQSNITVRNGTIAYCAIGIQIGGNGSATTNSVDHQIENMRVTYCYNGGILVFSSPASRVTNCQVSQTGYSGVYSAYGIEVSGSGATVQGCVVGTVTATSSVGIEASPGSFIRQNTVAGAYYGVYGGKYQDNLTSGCLAPYSNGIDAGGNN